MTNEERFEKLEAAADRLDNFIAALSMKAMPDSIHVAALRQGLPSVARDLRSALPNGTREVES